jgi:hypothetical protein
MGLLMGYPVTLETGWRNSRLCKGIGDPLTPLKTAALKAG